MKNYLNIITILLLTTVFFINTGMVQAKDDKKIKQIYSQNILKHIKDNWDYRITPENNKQSVVVALMIHKDGKVTEKKIVQQSQDPRFNVEVIRQLTAMEPFPVMPASIGAEHIKFNYTFIPNSLVVDLDRINEAKEALREVSK